MFELCNAVMWLAILPSLAGSERLIGKTRLLIAVAQLAVMHMAPQVWLQCRSVILTGSHILQCSLLMPWQLLGARSSFTAQLAGQDAPFSTVMMLASGFWSHLLFVLFHQQQFTIQAPLLALSTIVQGFYVISTPIQQTVLEALSNSLNRGFEQLIVGLFGNMSPALEVWRIALPEKTAVLTTILFLHIFSSFLLPVFLLYIIEWKLKVSFLLSECNSHNDQLLVLTPAAAVVRGSLLLSGLLYSGWLLLMALASWVVCSTVAAVLAPSVSAY